jgi:RNA polymerase sigma-70 factor, ECF subfamily
MIELATCDSDLAERIRRGDPEAEQELIRKFQSGVRQIILRVTGSLPTAEELGQEALLVTLRRLRSTALEDPSRLAAFVAQTARNLAIADRRKEYRRRTDSVGEEMDQVADAGMSPDGWAHAEGCARSVRELLGELRFERDRQILKRHYLDDEDPKDICRALGIAATAYNVALYRARQRFQEILARHGMTRETVLGSLPARSQGGL